MKIGELVKLTQVSKQTIHYYIREGLLPRPRKLGKNVANYNESYVDRIHLIKELQDHCFLPLSVIKKVLKFEKGSTEREWFLQLHTDYFRPVDKLLPTEIVGEKQFQKATGLGRRWLVKMEKWRILTPEIRKGQKVYSQDDLTLGKVIVDMDKIGLGPKDGFDPEVLKFYRDMFLDIVKISHRYYWQVGSGKLSFAEQSRKSVQARDIMGVFFYHLYRKLSREVHEDMALSLMESQTGENGHASTES
ncbi:MAG: MerR family transcriptional regulator [Syntrophobacteraceae bacterium]